MCYGCEYVHQAQGCWSCMSYSNFTKHKADLGKDCEHWEAIQKHRLCFHVSHEQPITWSECGHLRRHVNDALLVMHSRQDVPLPVLMKKDSFMRKVSPNSVTSKPFHVDGQCLSASKSLDLHVADLLSVELESGTSKRKAEQSAPNLTVRQGRRNFAYRS